MICENSSGSVSDRTLLTTKDSPYFILVFINKVDNDVVVPEVQDSLSNVEVWALDAAGKSLEDWDEDGLYIVGGGDFQELLELIEEEDLLGGVGDWPTVDELLMERGDVLCLVERDEGGLQEDLVLLLEGNGEAVDDGDKDLKQLGNSVVGLAVDDYSEEDVLHGLPDAASSRHDLPVDSVEDGLEVVPFSGVKALEKINELEYEGVVNVLFGHLGAELRANDEPEEELIYDQQVRPAGLQQLLVILGLRGGAPRGPPQGGAAGAGTAGASGGVARVQVGVAGIEVSMALVEGPEDVARDHQKHVGDDFLLKDLVVVVDVFNQLQQGLPLLFLEGRVGVVGEVECDTAGNKLPLHERQDVIYGLEVLQQGERGEGVVLERDAVSADHQPSRKRDAGVRDAVQLPRRSSSAPPGTPLTSNGLARHLPHTGLLIRRRSGSALMIRRKGLEKCKLFISDELERGE
ncbi:hypothetical protein OIY81_3650 [Cryptosporidium canis]|nr:hypothetical protein OIY81_3650 [Cryptosporidium canis]